jgi:hypothetical protein
MFHCWVVHVGLEREPVFTVFFTIYHLPLDGSEAWPLEPSAIVDQYRLIKLCLDRVLGETEGGRALMNGRPNRVCLL